MLKPAHRRYVYGQYGSYGPYYNSRATSKLNGMSPWYYMPPTTTLRQNSAQNQSPRDSFAIVSKPVPPQSNKKKTITRRKSILDTIDERIDTANEIKHSSTCYSDDSPSPESDDWDMCSDARAPNGSCFYQCEVNTEEFENCLRLSDEEWPELTSASRNCSNASNSTVTSRDRRKMGSKEFSDADDTMVTFPSIQSILLHPANDWITGWNGNAQGKPTTNGQNEKEKETTGSGWYLISDMGVLSPDTSASVQNVAPTPPYLAAAAKAVTAVKHTRMTNSGCRR